MKKKRCFECSHLNPENSRKCRKCKMDFSAGGWIMDDGSSESILDDYKDEAFGKSFNSNASETNVQFPKKMNVDVKDIDMSFGNMVMFMVKWAISSIPAFIILFLIGFAVAVALGLITSI